MPNLYDQVNKCIVSSGAFVTEVFQSSRVHFLDEMHEGKWQTGAIGEQK